MIPLHWEIENIDCEKFNSLSIQRSKENEWYLEMKSTFYKLYNITTSFNKKKLILLNHLQSQLFGMPGFWGLMSCPSFFNALIKPDGHAPCLNTGWSTLNRQIIPAIFFKFLFKLHVVTDGTKLCREKKYIEEMENYAFLNGSTAASHQVQSPLCIIFLLIVSNIYTTVEELYKALLQ